MEISGKLDSINLAQVWQAVKYFLGIKSTSVIGNNLSKVLNYGNVIHIHKKWFSVNECRICEMRQWKKKFKVLNYNQSLWDGEEKNGGEEAEADPAGTDGDLRQTVFWNEGSVGQVEKNSVVYIFACRHWKTTGSLSAVN